MKTRLAQANAPRALPLVIVVFGLLVLWWSPAAAQDTIRIVVTLEEESELPEHALRGLPATFIGTVPCPDCAGVRYHLDLLKEKQVYFLRQTQERGEGQSSDTIGMWGTTMDHTIFDRVPYGTKSPGDQRRR